MCLVSGADRVDLERLAAVVGRRDIRRATAREADELTGFSIGGIPPFGHNRRTRVIMDPELGRYATVWAAAGLPTAVFPVSPATLRMLADAHVAPIAEERHTASGRSGASCTDPAPVPVTAEPRDATIAYPGGLRARWRWGGSGQAAAVFASSEAGGELVDLGPEVSADPDALCRAELRVDGPAGAWTVRFASTINDEPAAQLWDTAGQLVVKYGFHGYGIDARTRRPALEPPLGDAAARPVRLVAPAPRGRSRRELETFADRGGRRRSPGGSPTRTS